ncbi:hypothetical protein FB45DRAFT_735414 [Roridomyces roridus]|uniref:NudC domain-containing protein 1 n=1 Tax=Roridomyces roridus TaxID=1738132 RepID=A0AAD7FUK2_9AGAR|nr:hypothetical protein FB45DRAFT_735414 [Roridomyces roridus]
MFSTKRELLNPKFEGYKLDPISQEDCVARHNLQYTATQATVSANTHLSFHEVQSRITHNHISVHGTRAVYVDAQLRVILVELDLKNLSPSFRAVFELPRPIATAASPREYPSAAFLSSSEIFVADGSGLLYILREASFTTFQLVGTYQLAQSTPFRIHSATSQSGAAFVILSSRNDTVDFNISAVKFPLPLPVSEGISSLQVVWQRRGAAVPISVSYDESRRAFMLLGEFAYGPLETPASQPYTPSDGEIAPIPRASDSEPVKPPPYSWTQTTDSVTVVFPLPSSTSTKDIKVTFSNQSLTLHVQGNIAPDVPLPHYSTQRLWDGISTSSSMWTWDRQGERHIGLLTLHLDKQHEGTKWSHVFEPSEDADVPETLDPSELWNIRESLEKYTAALHTGTDNDGTGLSSDLPSLAKGEMDDEVDGSIGRSAQFTWVGLDGDSPSWAPRHTDLPNRLLSTEVPGHSSASSLVLKNGLDGVVFALESASGAEAAPSWAHTSTFSALSFVLASKTDTRFTFHIPSKAVFAFENGSRGRASNVYIYRAGSPTELWAKQAVLRVGQEGSLLGVGAIKSDKETVLLCLTEKELVLIHNIRV